MVDEFVEAIPERIIEEKIKKYLPWK